MLSKNDIVERDDPLLVFGQNVIAETFKIKLKRMKEMLT